MQPFRIPKLKAAALLGFIGMAAIVLWLPAQRAHGQPSPTPGAATGAETNASKAASVSATNSAATNAPDAAVAEPKKLPTDLIELSFQNMQIDQVLQWLAENTGKSVVKHSQVNGQITIVSPKKMARQEAVTMVYRALAMEGFAAIETSTSILIMPTEQETKLNLSPELSVSTNPPVAGGRERMVKVFPLKHLPAGDITEKIKTVLSKDATVVTDDRANLLIVTDLNDNLYAAEMLINALDVEMNDDAVVRPMRTFDLKHADAEDVARQLQNLSHEPSSGNNPFFFNGDRGDRGDRDSKRISFVADRRRNAIVVQAPPGVMAGISNTIVELDAPVSDNTLAPKIVPLENVSAGDIEDVLNDLFLKKTQQQPYFYYFGEDPPTTTDRDVGRLYGKVRITSVAAANALIITANSEENLDVVTSIIKELDKPSSAGDTTYHVRLNFGDAEKIANRINILFAKNGSQPLRPQNQPNPNTPNTQQPPQPQQGTQTTPAADDFSLEQVVKEDPYYPWLGGNPDFGGRNSRDSSSDRPVSDLVGRVRVVPDEARSSLLVSANVHMFTQVSKMIQEMDVPPAEVLIEAKIVQVSADYLDQIGVRYSPNGSEVFSGSDLQNSLMPHVGGTYIKGVGGNTTVNNPVNAGSGTTASIVQSLSSLRSGVLDGTISMDFLIQFLQQRADATVISEPHLTISDNDLGKLFVGQAIPIETGNLNPATGGSSQSFDYRNVGVIVEVEPHINEAGDVQLRIRTESSTLDPTQILGLSVIDSAQFRTELTAKQGQTLVLGGIIQKQINDTVYRTPILGSIPLLKYAFSKHDKSIKRTELLVFLRPKIVRTPEQARQMLEDAREETPLLQKLEEKEKNEAGKELEIK